MVVISSRLLIQSQGDSRLNLTVSTNLKRLTSFSYILSSRSPQYLLPNQSCLRIFVEPAPIGFVHN